MLCATASLARMPEWAGRFGTEIVLIKPPAEFLGGWCFVFVEGTKTAIVIAVVAVVVVVVVIVAVVVVVVAVVVVVVLFAATLNLWVVEVQDDALKKLVCFPMLHVHH